MAIIRRAYSGGDWLHSGLTPPGDSSAQAIPNFIGRTTHHPNNGHLIWLPDQITILGSTWHYADQADYKVLVVMHGQGSTPTNAATNTLAVLKAAMTAGTLPPCIIVFVNGKDPHDNIDGWCLNSAGVDWFGAFPEEDMIRFDIPRWLRDHTRTTALPANTAMIGFSMGAFSTLRMRAKFGVALAAAYCALGSPRFDNDLGADDQAYGTFSAAEQAKLFNNLVANCRANCPFSSTSGQGLFNILGANAGGLGAAPLLVIKSAADSVTLNSMNNGITRLTNAGVTFAASDVVTPTHDMALYFTAWGALGTANDTRWIKVNAGW